MFNGLANYLFGGERLEAENTEYSFEYNTQEEDDWLLVNTIGKDPTERKAKESTADFAMIPSLPVLPSTLSMITVHLPDHQAFPSPLRNPQMEESWYVTPPPCFMAGEPIQIETSPLENLLIEHPSMSVYTSSPNSSFSTTASKKELNFKICSSKKQKTETEVITHEVSPSISVQFIIEKKKIRNQNNKPTVKKSCHQSMFPIICTDLFERIANVKHGQKAKYYLEQKLLHHSKLDRQNRTTHYQHSAKNLRRKDHWHCHSGANNNLQKIHYPHWKMHYLHIRSVKFRIDNFWISN